MKEAYMIMCAYMYPFVMAFIMTIIMYGFIFIIKKIHKRYNEFCDEWDRHVRRLRRMAEKENARKSNIGL